MELKNAIAKYVIGDIVADDLPSVAQLALEEGHDSPSLCKLAAAQGLDGYMLRTLFSNALEELAISTPSPAEAGLAIARSIAEDVLKGRITPYAGAKQIWSAIYTRFPEIVELRTFVGFASEYEDDEKHQNEYARMIVDECKVLLFGKKNS